MEVNLNGFRPEPESAKYWWYEDKLKDRMSASQGTGDVDLRPFSSPRHNQVSTSSCVANAVVKALEIKRIMEHGHEGHIDLSRLVVYYLARELMFPPETNKDAGTYISLGFDVIRRFGVPPEADWPFHQDKLFTPPSWRAMRKAYLHKIDSFFKIRSTGSDRVDEVVRCLQAGNPVVFGTTVGDNWRRYRKDQVLSLPEDATGRHATVLVGVQNGTFLGENSWGGWGDNGFYRMDPEVIASDDSKDFWVPVAGYEFGEWEK